MEQLGFYWLLYEIWYLNIFRKSSQKIPVTLNLTGITGTLREGQ